MPATAPEHLPVLSRGAHSHPDDGACLMEYVSLLAGERFSDRPGCTHPLLAQIARLVNDTSPDGVRPELAGLAPGLIGTSGPDPRVAPALVACCGEVGLDAAPGSFRLRRYVRRARRRLERLEGARGRKARLWMRLSDPLYQHGSAAPAVGHTLTALARLPQQRREAELRRLLREASNVCRHYNPSGQPDRETPAPGPVPAP